MRTSARMNTEGGGSVAVVGVAPFGIRMSRATPCDLQDLRSSANAEARDMPGSRQAIIVAGLPDVLAAVVAAGDAAIDVERT